MAIVALQLLAFIWGASIGSFLNVVIFRLPEGLSIVRPGSRCPACETPIRWFDNIPVLSYIVLRGRCRQCRKPFSPRYMLVEAATGVLVLSLFRATVLPLDFGTFTHDLAMWLWTQIFVYALIAIAFIDLAHTFIPHELSLPTLVIGVVGAFVLRDIDGYTHLWGALGGAGFILLIIGIGWIMFRRESMGFGDATLLAVIGAYLGWQALPFVVFAASIQGLLAAGGAIVWSRLSGSDRTLVTTTDELDARFGEEERFAHLKPRHAIPFGPFLAIAALEALFFGDQLFWRLADSMAAVILDLTA